MVSGRGARSRFVGGAAISDEEEGPGVADGAVDTEEVEPGRVMVGQERLAAVALRLFSMVKADEFEPRQECCEGM